MSLEESNHRINRLIAMHKILSEANKASLPSQVEKRKRSTSAVNAVSTAADQLQQLTSSPTSISPVQKRSKRVGSKKSLVWKHFDTGLRGQDPIATCKYCGQVYACDRSTHGTSTLWNHLRFLCPQEPLKGQDLQRKNQGTPKHSWYPAFRKLEFHWQTSNVFSTNSSLAMMFSFHTRLNSVKLNFEATDIFLYKLLRGNSFDMYWNSLNVCC